MQLVRLTRIMFGVTFSVLIFALSSPTLVVQADTTVPCNNGEKDHNANAATPFDNPQDPNNCPADNSQQPQGEHQQSKAEFDSGVPGKTPQAPISTGQKLDENDRVNACLNFDDDSTWNGIYQNRWYAGWGIQAVNKEGPKDNKYKENASFQQERNVGGGYSMKLAHSKPFEALVVSPEFEIPVGSKVVAKVSYYIGKPAKETSARVEISVHYAGDESAPVRIGYYNEQDQWRKLASEEFTTSTAAKIQVTLKVVNEVNDQKIAIYFDNIEIWVDGLRVKDCSEAGKLITVGVPVPKTGTPTPPDTTVLGVADVAKQNTSVVNSGEGEILIHSNDILDRNRAKKVGSLSIYCLSAGTTNKSVCKWFVITITLNDGTLNDSTLTVAGTGNINNGGNLPVIGGTGSYAKINGYVILSPIENNSTQLLSLVKR